MSNYEVTFTHAQFCVLVKGAADDEHAIEIARGLLPRGFDVEDVEAVETSRLRQVDAIVDAGDEP